MHTVLTSSLGLLARLGHSQQDLLLENFALRHQLAICERPTRVTAIDRLVWAYVLRRWSGSAGADPKTLQARLGHETLEMTMSVYAHRMNDDATAPLPRLWGSAPRSPTRQPGAILVPCLATRAGTQRTTREQSPRVFGGNRTQQHPTTRVSTPVRVLRI